tara:strand:+ start:1696 stop:1824 length:129 start_codon:yes stop_codon:yes gene_type:complete
MNTKIDHLVNSIFEKFKKHKSEELNLKKDEFKDFILQLIRDN